MKSLRFYLLSVLVASVIWLSSLASAEQPPAPAPVVDAIVSAMGGTTAQRPQPISPPVKGGNIPSLPQTHCPSLGDEAYLYTEAACVEARESASNPVSETPHTVPEVATLDGEIPWRSSSRRRRPNLEARDRPIPAADNRTAIAAKPNARSPRFPKRIATQPTNDPVIPLRSSQLASPLATVPNRVTLLGILCKTFVAQAQEFAPVQLVNGGKPSISDQIVWTVPAQAIYTAPFSGIEGSPAGHEGTDYVHNDPKVTDVPVVAAAKGRVVYVRAGCPQSKLFGVNRELRECGAGWGNHVVVDHGDGLLSRYAHLAPESISVQVGDPITAGQFLGQMGNTGRSDTRHLHFEVGFAEQSLDACAPAQSFDWVYNPAVFGV